MMMRSIKKSVLIALGLLGSLSLANAGPLELFLQQMQEKEQNLLAPKTIRQSLFTQLIDHKNPATGTFSQRYYLDETYGPGKDAPVFFYICGESACSKGALSGAIRKYAQTHHAKLVALEHRYYGKSLPFNSFSTKSLRYLTTDAALEDLAYFQRHLQNKNDWTGPWISFGGSYPGSLSAYYRLKYPYLVAGALASSAPVMAKEDFIEYDRHVTEVAGLHCANQIRQVVSEVEATLNNPEQLTQMKALFEASEIRDPVDFLYLIADTGAAAIQYGMRDTFCNYLDKGTTPLTGYADFAKYMYSVLGVSAEEITAQGAMSEDPNDYGKFVGQRQWYYQSCTEYGYWQTANPESSLSTRSSLINLDYHRQICHRLFGLNKAADTGLLNNTYYYPLMDELVSNIFFTNGENDPWSTLSLAEKNGNAINSNFSYQLIDGAAHCDDLRTPKPSDSAAIIKARKTMDSLLGNWLK